MAEDHDLAFLRRMLAERGVAQNDDPAAISSAILICSYKGDERVPSFWQFCDGGCGSLIVFSKLAPACRLKLCLRCAAIEIARDPSKFTGFAYTAATVADIEAYLRGTAARLQ